MHLEGGRGYSAQEEAQGYGAGDSDPEIGKDTGWLSHGATKYHYVSAYGRRPW